MVPIEFTASAKIESVPYNRIGDGRFKINSGAIPDTCRHSDDVIKPALINSADP
jgi:hypothetical protein